ncbi:capsular associated protein, glycosyltransferase family 90 protein [Pseudohyphozyma bogoriensis]|nr:capsular associated protein, glycosyltransferase family 90 protein [Pseudohyphozyma bogoriensis]
MPSCRIRAGILAADNWVDELTSRGKLRFLRDRPKGIDVFVYRPSPADDALQPLPRRLAKLSSHKHRPSDVEAGAYEPLFPASALPSSVHETIHNVVARLRPLSHHAVARKPVLVALTLLVGLTLTLLSPSRPQLHPLPALLADAEVAYSNLHQPSSLREAYDDYVRRHKRKPPPGWDVWFQNTQANVPCPQVDGGFREMYRSLEMWWGVSPKEIRDRVEQLGEPIGKMPDGKTTKYVNAFGRVRVRNGKLVKRDDMIKQGISVGLALDWSDFVTGFQRQVEAVIASGVVLPDIDYWINVLDEPRVTVPYELRKSLEQHAALGTVRVRVDETPHFGELGQPGQPGVESAYDVLRRSCPPSSLARRTPLSAHPGQSPQISTKYTKAFTTTMGNFLASPRAERETWCDQPDLQDLHQGFIHPLSYSVSTQLYPVFSNSKLEGYNDILIPTWWNWDGKTVFKESEDVAWKAKADNLFWRGANTGGLSIGLNWQGWLRSRFISRLNQPLSWRHHETIHFATSSGLTSSVTIPTTAVSTALANVAFVGVDHGDDDSLAAQKSEPSFRFAEMVPFKDNYASKAIMDMDGTAYSGRFVALMGSKSAVFKSRLFIEAMEDSLVPWYHYVPVSVRFTEIYDLLGYFFGGARSVSKVGELGIKMGEGELRKATEGVSHEEQLKRIAERGAEWSKKCARREDMMSYVHLLTLDIDQETPVWFKSWSEASSPTSSVYCGIQGLSNDNHSITITNGPMTLWKASIDYISYSSASSTSNTSSHNVSDGVFWSDNPSYDLSSTIYAPAVTTYAAWHKYEMWYIILGIVGGLELLALLVIHCPLPRGCGAWFEGLWSKTGSEGNGKKASNGSGKSSRSGSSSASKSSGSSKSSVKQVVILKNKKV